MLTSAQIGKAGEVYVSNWLSQKGYSGICNTRLPGSTDIEASGVINGSTIALLVQVKTAVWPNIAPMPSQEEITAIVARAKKLNRQAWSARVQINNKAEIVGDIAWLRLG